MSEKKETAEAGPASGIGSRIVGFIGGIMKRHRVALPVAVLVLGAATAVVLATTGSRPTPEAPRERSWLVMSAPVEITDVRPDLTLFGTVVAGREVNLRALVAGQIVQGGETLREGGVISKGDLVARIDDFDYRVALDQVVAQQNEAEARLEELHARRRSEEQALQRDLEQVALARRDYARAVKLREKGTVSDKFLDDSTLALSRQEQTLSIRQNMLVAESSRISQQEAAIERLAAAARSARRNLERTVLRAPFNGFVSEISAELGQRLNVNDSIARLVDADRLEVRFALSNDQYGRILAAEGSLTGRPGRVIWKVGGAALKFDAVVERVGSNIDTRSGGVAIYSVVLGAGVNSALRPGAFVEIQMPDRVYPQVAELPETSLYDSDHVYVIDGGRLEKRAVSLVARYGDRVLVAGDLRTGEVVNATRFAEIGPGVKVEVR